MNVSEQFPASTYGSWQEPSSARLPGGEQRVDTLQIEPAVTRTRRSSLKRRAIASLSPFSNSRYTLLPPKPVRGTPMAQQQLTKVRRWLDMVLGNTHPGSFRRRSSSPLTGPTGSTRP